MLFAQTTNYTYEITSNEVAGGGLFAGMFLTYFLISLAIWIVGVVAMWKIFEKAGEQGWKAIVPVYNFWVLCEIVGKPGWWSLIILLMMIPFINFIAWIPALIVIIIVSLELGKAFGKDTVWSVLLLVLFSLFGYVILGFGKDTFDKSRLSNNNQSSGGNDAGAPPQV